jgi:hypothetical protein
VISITWLRLIRNDNWFWRKRKKIPRNAESSAQCIGIYLSNDCNKFLQWN